jgi:prepilin-type N-terminal cleavage/methylation domain-containing protein
MACRRPGVRTRKGAFTLLELLVVIGILLILSGLSFHVIRVAVRSTRIAQARVEIQNLKGAIGNYRMELSAYPPDTGDWNETAFDPKAVHRYLGSELVEPVSKRKLKTFFSIERERYKPLDADGFGVFKDPWGRPYHIDAMHMLEAGGERRPGGEPYLPSRPEIEKTKDVKIISFGPDGVSGDYPFDEETPDPRAADDIRSW